MGIIGLGVMGENLVLNVNDHGFKVAVFNRTVSKVEAFLEGAARGTAVIGATGLKEFAALLKRPRKVMLMVKAGEAVEELLEELLPVLEKGDVVMDGGNSHFKDTMRRTENLERRGFLYMGVGISGGEEGARLGPSIMAGGSSRAWRLTNKILRSIAARTPDGSPCCDWVGENGAGHFVKMVHNGIEYSEMQLLCEAYHLMKEGLGLSYEEMGKTFARWNRGDLESYLMEITADILGFKDEDGAPMVEKILDVAGQKGTGRWMCIESMQLGVPVTMIAEAVYARTLSALKEERLEASRILRESKKSRGEAKNRRLGHIRKSLLASRTASYAQGFMLMAEAARVYGWKLSFGRIALVWRAGCIIRSALLDRMRAAFEHNPSLRNLMVDPYFSAILRKCQASWRRVVVEATSAGIPVPVLSAGLSFFDGYRNPRLPANLLQAQRDYFGAHTYERVDRPRGELFHSQWKTL